MQRGFVEGQRVDGAQPLLVQRGIGREAAQQEIGQHQQQAKEDQPHPGRGTGHGWEASGPGTG